MIKNITYNKHNSFVDIKSKNKININELVVTIKNLYEKKKDFISSYEKKIISRAIDDLIIVTNDKKKFQLTTNVIDEITSIEEDNILKYIFHRYRYEIFPEEKILDSYPPYLQIEPSSICNYRCVFCFMTDPSFNNKKHGYMGTMSLDLFKEIIDQAEGNIEFISLASRGEPMACKDIDKMLEYTTGKFLNLKINTNASLLDEKKIHSILKGGVKTLVFSVDAADEKLYSELRVNGKLKTILKNIELFNKIKSKDYRKSKIITRVSGVKFSKKQNFEEMLSFWSNLVDQVAFVEYNSWENSYDKQENEITKPCSDLWRRMFVWWDGIVNPCDVDYKSFLSTGSILQTSIKDSWLSKNYQKLRSEHTQEKRKNLNPCKSCNTV